MDSNYDIPDIKFRLQKKVAVTPDEFANLLQQDHEALFDYMLMNNPSSVNYTLKYKLKIAALPFVPDMKQLNAQIKMLIAKNDKDQLQMIFDNFRYNPNSKTASKELEMFLRPKFPNWFK